jgi:ankyrin repeat protein
MDIHEAAMAGDMGAVGAYLRNGGDVNAKDYRGLTALICAALKCQTAVAKLLVDSGADLETRDNNGKTALALAGGELLMISDMGRM